jgi:hypothetical protein
MKSLMVVLAIMVVLLMGFALCRAQVYEFSKPNVPVNDDSLGRYWHYPHPAGMHALVTRGDTLYATWYDNRDGNYKIYFSNAAAANDTATGSDNDLGGSPTMGGPSEASTC